MIINVHLRDGRTTFQFASRGDMRKLVARGADEDGRPVDAWARWTPESEWKPARVNYLGRSSIAFIVSAQDEAAEDAAQLPAKAEADARVARFEKREAA